MARMPDETIAQPPLAETAPSAPAPAAPEGARIGRYTHAQLSAMQGKRGRKPPEFYELFPRSDAPAAKPTAAGKVQRKRRVAVEPQVSSAVLGEHTIDELLAMIGSTGKKPVAFGILHAVAEVFVAQGAVELPPPADPLVAALLAAPPALRALVGDLLASAKPQAKRGRKPAAASADA